MSKHKGRRSLNLIRPRGGRHRLGWSRRVPAWDALTPMQAARLEQAAHPERSIDLNRRGQR